MAKDSPRTKAGEFQKIVEFRGQKTLNKIIKQHLHHHMFLGKVKKNKNSGTILSPKNYLQHIQLSDTTGTSNGTGFYGQTELKNEPFGRKHSRWVW